MNADYTVTLPEGVVTNISTLFLYASYGHKVTFDGSKTTWVMPTADGNTYGKFEIHSAMLKNGLPAQGNMCFKRYSLADKATGPGTFENFTLSLASHCDDVPGTVLELTGASDWTGGSVRMFTEAADADGRVEFRFKDGSMASLMKMEYGFANPTNIVTFSNYRAYWLDGMSFAPAAGVLGNDEPGLFEIDYTDGSMITNRPTVNANQGSILSLGYSGSATQQSYAKTFRVKVDKGSLLSICNMTASGKGHYEINVSGEGSTLNNTHMTSTSTIGKGSMSTSTVSVVDRACFRVDGLIEFGDTATEGQGTLILSNSTAVFRRRVKLNRGTFLLQDADITLYSSETDNEFSGGGVADVPAELYADGTTIHFTQNRSRTLVKDFSVAKLGPKGLTLSVENNYAFDVPQNFTDWTTGGTLTTLGRANYPLVLTGTDSQQSNLVVARETTKLAAGANHYAHVTVKDGATFSLVGGQTAPLLRQLTLGDDETVGILALDPGTVVTVDGAINFVNPEIAFSSDLSVGTNTVFRQTVEPADETVVMWEVFTRGTISAGLPSGKYVRLQVVQDGEEWLYQIVIADSAPVLEGSTTWTGAGSSSWNDDANWADGQPDVTHAAAFGGTAVQTVTVSGTVDAGGLSFGNEKGTTLAGGRIRISDNSSAAITATAGTNTIASQVQMTSRVAVPVAEGAQLTVSGEVIGGGFAKTDAGRLVVENAANRFAVGFGLNGGWLEFTSLGAFGYVFASTVSDLVSGTLEYTGEAGATPIATEISGPVVYKPESELAMKLPSATAGAIVKRGAGRLVFDVTADATLTLDGARDSGFYEQGDRVSYPADGSAPTPHPTISVNEGELVFRGSGESVPKVTIDNRSVAVGVPVAEHSGAVGQEPGLVIDHAHLYLHDGILALANGLTAGETFAYEPYLIVTNGGILECALQPNKGKTGGKGSRIYVNGATIVSPVSLNSQQDLLTTNTFTVVNKGLIAGSRHTFHGSSVMVFSNSVWASGYTWGNRSTLGACQVVNYDVKETGTLTDWTFADGSIFACSSLEQSVNNNRRNPHTLRFDNSEWWGGTGDKAFATAGLNVTTVLSGEGLLQQPSEGKTYSWITPVIGDGKFVMCGAGAVWFKPQEKYHAVADDPVTLGYSGLTDVQSGLFKVDETALSNFVGRAFRVAGTLDLGGASVTGAVITAAGGAVTNATLVTPTIALEYDDEGAAKGLTLDDANALALERRVVVDFGVEEDGGRGATALPVGTILTVATFTGTAPNVSNWRSKNVGAGLKAHFSVQGKNVLATVSSKSGFMLIIR